MLSSTFLCDATPVLRCRALTGTERLGEPSRFELEIVSPEPVDIQAVLAQAAAVRLTNAFGERLVHGLVTRITQIATTRHDAVRVYRITLQSAVHPLVLRTRTRVFQHLTVPAILEHLLDGIGIGSERRSFRLAAEHAERRYVVQYAETDLAFLQRLCEDEGLYYRFEPEDRGARVVFEDTSTSAPAAIEQPLQFVDASALPAGAPAAFSCEMARERRPGRVALRDYDPKKPSLGLEGRASSGAAPEGKIEVYEAPGGFSTPSGGDARARLRLESLRAEHLVVRFSTTALTLAPGLAVTLERGPDHAGSAQPEGDFLVIAVEHDLRDGSPTAPRVTAIPLDVPYRLARRTPRPRIFGLHPAVVTGAPGDEIHADADGCVKVHFFWDRSGPTDHTSSLPVRVVQNNLPGAMLLPRVGWEVFVAFEDGDPDRPYIVGRAYNATHPPPFPLPANKTITSLATVSSPGGGRQNSVHFDDASGRQHLAWNAGFGKSTTVGNDMTTQTVGFEHRKVGAAQTVKVGANQTVSVANASIHDLGSQTASVGAVQDVSVKGNSFVKVGSETVAIGGALIEQVGSPGAAFGTLLEEAAITVAGEIPVVGPFVPLASGIAKAVDDTAKIYQHSGGNKEAAGAVALQHLLGIVDSHVPGIDSAVAALGATKKAPWDSEEVQKAREAAAKAEGAGGPGAAGAGSGGGAGHRETVVNGAMIEQIGGANMVTAALSVKSTTAGASVLTVGGSHVTRAARVSHLCFGASSETAATIGIDAGVVGRTAKGALATTVGGALSCNAGGAYHVKASSITLKVGGSMTASGGVVAFVCGGAELVASPGGVLVKAGTVTVDQPAKTSGKQHVG